jgi:hypothetical protein
MRARLVLVPLAAIAAFALASCDPKGAIAPNAAPETRLFVQFDPGDTTSHTVHHEVHLFWLGTDVDGDVVAYEYRFLPTVDPEGGWVRTTRTDSVFVLPAPTDSVRYGFEVRAIDDAGAVDLTPARQDFDFRNAAPTVSFLTPPTTRDTTYPSMTLQWTGLDPDGDANDLSYRVWLDGANPAEAPVITATTYTIPSAAFRIDGHWSSRPRTVSIQAFDAGGRGSAIVQATWFVRAPVPDTTLDRGALLVVDNMRNAQPGGAAFDNAYNTAIAQSQTPGTWSVLRLEVNQPFRSAADVLQTLSLYDAVAWYRGSENSFAPLTNLLRDYQSSIGAYVENGGRFYLESLDMIDATNSPGILSEAFMREYLGADALYLRRFESDEDSTANWGIQSAYSDTFRTVDPPEIRNNLAILRTTLFADSLRQTQIYSGLRGFVVRDTGNVVLWARDSVLSQRPTFDVPIAVQASHPGGGRFVAVSTPLAGANGFNSAIRFIVKIFNSLKVPGS